MKKGVTLVEVVISVMVLGIVLGGILMVFMNCMFLNDANRNTARAIGHAQYVMEDIMREIKNTTCVAVNATIAGVGWDWNTGAITGEGLTPLDNEGIGTIAAWENFDDLLNVTVTVGWWDRRARARSIFLRTLFTDL